MLGWFTKFLQSKWGANVVRPVETGSTDLFEPTVLKSLLLENVVPPGSVAFTGEVVAGLVEGLETGDVATVLGDGVVLANNASEVLADVTGLVSHANERLQIVPLLVVSEDEMSVMLIRQTDGVVAELKRAQVKRALVERGIKHIDGEQVDLALAAELETDAIAAVGRAIQAGVMGTVEFDVATDLSTGNEREDGTLDFRDREMESAVVRLGDRVATLVVTTQGVDGYTVFNEVLPAEVVGEFELEAGDGVELLGNEYIAEWPGRVRLRNGVLLVEQSMDIRGDVDYGTGHVNSRALGVAISGGVLPGFHVISGGDVDVAGAVDDALIRGGADVRIRGGLIGREAGNVNCRGSFSARFIQGGSVASIGDVRIAASITQAHVQTAGVIEAMGTRGCITGGKCTASTGIRTKKAGSSAGTLTVLRVGELGDSLRLLESVVVPRELRLEELKKLLGRHADNWDADKAPSLLDEDYLEYRQLKETVAELRELQDSVQKTALEISDARIVVAGPCHPGVLVQIAGQTFEVTRLLTQVVFFIDPLTNALTYGPYKPETERGAASAEK